MPGKVAIVHTRVNRNDFPSEVQYLTEKDSREEATLVGKYLDRLSVKYKLISASENIFKSLKDYKPDMILNMTGSISGKEYLSALVPGIAEVLNIPCTGSSFRAEVMAFNKSYLKSRMSGRGLTVPEGYLINRKSGDFPQNLPLPAIVKLNSIHGSVEINREAICQTRNQAKKRALYLMKKYHDDILIEEFIEGEEFSVICFENKGVKVYAAKNIFGPENNPRSFASFDYQWDEVEIGFEKFEDYQLTELAIKGFSATGMRDYGKFDVRRNSSGTYYFIDGNTNPAFGPKEGDCALGTVLDLYGISFEEVLKMLFTNVSRRLSSASQKVR